MADVHRLLAVALILALVVATPAVADEEEPGGIDAATYLAMFDDADLRGIERPPDEVYDLFIDITGNAGLDARIRAAAAARGYRRRPIASIDLVAVDGLRIQPPAAEAWLELKAAARADGISLKLTSAFRDLRDQQSLFRQRLDGRTSDAAIDATLRFRAPPGYSRHHTGYAIDVGQAGTDRVGFVNTRAYAWLAKDDFARVRAVGFIPGYPEGGENMGPDPEPWELVWVGTGRIVCALGGTHPTGFCDVLFEPRVDDIAWLADLGVTVGCAPGRFCPDDPVTRGEAASLIWRLHGAPPATTAAPFDDVFDRDHFAPAVAWLYEVGLVQGTTAITFSPDDLLSADDVLALFVRLAALDDLPAPNGILGPIADFVAGPVVVGDVGTQISRVEFASILRSAAVRPPRRAAYARPHAALSVGDGREGGNGAGA